MGQSEIGAFPHSVPMLSPGFFVAAIIVTTWSNLSVMTCHYLSTKHVPMERTLQSATKGMSIPGKWSKGIMMVRFVSPHGYIWLPVACADTSLSRKKVWQSNVVLPVMKGFCGQDWLACSGIPNQPQKDTLSVHSSLKGPEHAGLCFEGLWVFPKVGAAPNSCCSF